MTRAAVLSPRAAAFERIKSLVLDTLPSPESKRAYGSALDDFFRWCEAQAVSEFSKAVVNSYRVSLEERSLRPPRSTNACRPFERSRWKQPTTDSCRPTSQRLFPG